MLQVSDQMRVKICGVRTREAALAAAQSGASAVGFVFADSPRRVTPEEAQRLTAFLIPSVARVAVFRHPTEQEEKDALAYMTEVDNPAEAGQDLMWALLNSPEFLFNR